MAFSKIVIEFNEVPNVDEVLYFVEESLGVNLLETFKESRNTLNQTTIPSFSPDDGIHPDRYFGFISTNYKNALNLDINSGGLFTIQWTTGPPYSGIGTVIITANYANAVFTVDLNTTSATVTITNEASIPTFNITDIAFSQASSPNTHIRVTVATSELATEVLSPLSISNNSYNPYFYDWIRGATILVSVKNANGNYASRTVELPKLLSAANFTARSLNTPNGATTTVSNVNSEGLVLQYSLDNVTWQTSNIFSGLASGDFTLYVKDQYGAEISKTFKVSEFNINSPYFLISKSNSIRYAKRIAFGTSSNYKNDENTLSCEVDVQKAHKEIQRFQSADSITTQFKSNYAENDAVVIKADRSEVAIPVIKRSSNIGLKEKRDARKYDLGGGKTGIYFISGNIYDYNTSTVVSSYSLNGSLPFWAQAKKYIVVNNDWFQIEEIVFDESKNAEVIIIEDNYSGQEINVIAGSIYNLFDYDIYEYTVNMGDFINENIRVRLNNTDNNFGSIVHLSEMINVKERQENTIEIKYKNTDNTDIFYGTGIEHKIRQQYQKISGFKEDPSENYKTDTNTVLLSAEIYEGDEFLLQPVTKEMMRKIVRALSHKIVYIDEIGYCKNGDIEVEGPLDKSNLYVVKAKMIKNGNVYNANSASGNDDEIYNGESYEVLGLVSGGVGFMRF